MFGRPIYDYAVGDAAALRRVAERKRRVIANSSRATAYIETSHAFLKSWSDLAIEFFPGMKLVHLVRNPLSVAKSEAIREELIQRWRFPFRNYHGGDGKSYFRWALTGLEPIFSHVAGRELSRFQWYVVQWIEIENRAMRFLQQYGKQADCHTLHSPVELNDSVKVQSLLDFLGLPCSDKLVLEGRQNRTPGVKNEITERDKQELAEVVGLLPASCLEIFERPPYCDWEWSRQSTGGTPPPE